MWSNVYFDYSMHKNFNVGFSSHKNDIHIQLSQWQYWWWFWFAAVWALYFFVILRIYNNKTEQYNVTLNTSMRSHGKWGDFLVALIPLSWCGNILINSNFILRMIEWQNESSLFVIRIQGKQWYWSYKYSHDTNYRLNSVYLNIGNDNWVKNSFFSNYNYINENSTLHFIFDYEFKKIHKSLLSSKKLNKFLLKGNHNALKNSISKFNTLKLNIEKINKFGNYYTNHKVVDLTKPLKFNTNLTKIDRLHYKNCSNLKIENILIKNTPSFEKKISKPLHFSLFTTNFFKNNLFELNKLDDTFVGAENFRYKNTRFKVYLQKGILNKLNRNKLKDINTLDYNILLNVVVNNSEVSHKQSHLEQFWGFRQKRYKKLRSYTFSKNNLYTNNNNFFFNNYWFNKKLNKYYLYNSVKNNKHKNELIPVTLARRLLRTKRTLVLPVHINITLITNSYDVVHSWFVPGLGIKIDCVPGRSTHHSLYIDNVGFYYGQCAEICGRYHHHMPIRVCALPYEHFVLWWQTKGLPRMYRSEVVSSNKLNLISKFN